jgi:hypothetical protein
MFNPLAALIESAKTDTGSRFRPTGKTPLRRFDPSAVIQGRLAPSQLWTLVHLAD